MLSLGRLPDKADVSNSYLHTNKKVWSTYSQTNVNNDKSQVIITVTTQVGNHETLNSVQHQVNKKFDLQNALISVLCNITFHVNQVFFKQNNLTHAFALHSLYAYDA